MIPRTNPYTRDELLEHAKHVLAGHKHVVEIAPPRSSALADATRRYDMQEAIVAVLENYPLAQPAAESVRVIIDDLAERGGFREVIENIGASEWMELRAFLVAKLASTVVYVEPKTTEPETLEINFA